MEQLPPNPEIIEKAQQLNRTAMLITGIRRDCSVAFGIIRILQEPGWPLAAATAGMALTDKADGYLARKAAALVNQQTSSEGAKLDHEADKWFYYGQMGGMAIRHYIESRHAGSLFLAANMGVVAIRDHKMADVRRAASANRQDTKAQKQGKLKTALQMGSIIIASSPAVRHQKGRWLTHALVTAGTFQSIISYRSFKRNMQKR